MTSPGLRIGVVRGQSSRRNDRHDTRVDSATHFLGNLISPDLRRARMPAGTSILFHNDTSNDSGSVPGSIPILGGIGSKGGKFGSDGNNAVLGAYGFSRYPITPRQPKRDNGHHSHHKPGRNSKSLAS